MNAEELETEAKLIISKLYKKVSEYMADHHRKPKYVFMSLECERVLTAYNQSILSFKTDSETMQFMGIDVFHVLVPGIYAEIGGEF